METYVRVYKIASEIFENHFNQDIIVAEEKHYWCIYI